jgi:hypothetical protein
MKIYREPIYKYRVVDFGRFRFRFGYTKPEHTGTMKYVSRRIVVLTLWLFGVFLQVDWDRRRRLR